MKRRSARGARVATWRWRASPKVAGGTGIRVGQTTFCGTARAMQSSAERRVEPPSARGYAAGVHFDQMVGTEFLERADGIATVRLNLREEHHGVHGFVHGGVVCTLAHQSAGSAVYSLCRDGQEAVIIEMKINFLGASWAGALESRSEVVRMGGRTAFVETRISGSDGELRATATATFLVLTRALEPPSSSSRDRP